MMVSGRGLKGVIDSRPTYPKSGMRGRFPRDKGDLGLLSAGGIGLLLGSCQCQRTAFMWPSKIPGVKVVSFFPGRVKIRVDALEGKADFAHSLQSDLRKIDGIKLAEVDAEAATVLIKYEKKRITVPASVDALFGTLTRHFPDIDFSKLRQWFES